MLLEGDKVERLRLFGEDSCELVSAIEESFGMKFSEDELVQATTKKELMGHLRSKRRIRRSHHSRIFRDSRGQIVDAISIRERPAEIRDRAIPGHWEGDLIGGSKNSHVVTLVERHSRFTALVKVPSKDTAVCVVSHTPVFCKVTVASPPSPPLYARVEMGTQ